MKILAISTRDYYDLVSSEKWEKIKCPLLITYISNLYNGDIDNEEDYVQDFFIQDKEGERFWEENQDGFSVIKRISHDSQYTIYIIPCIPRDHVNKNTGKCKSLKIRHDYIGLFLNSILNDSKMNVDANDIFVAVHDLDIFENNDERNLGTNEAEPNSSLFNLIKEGKVLPDNIFGFQHENVQNSFYSLFNQKLGRDALPPDTLESIFSRIRTTAGREVERVVMKRDFVNARTIATAKPITPIPFSFSINTEKRFSCSMPEAYKEKNNAEYATLFNAITSEHSQRVFDCEAGEYSAYLLIHHISDIQGYAKRHEQYVFGQNYFTESGTIRPVIHFCDASLEELTEIYRYASVIDCSIWNHYVQIKRNNDCSTISFVDEVQLENAISDIANNSSRHLYNLVVARESADLVARMIYASFIKRFPETEGHGDYVSPFVFHSEQAVKNHLIYEEFEETNKIEQIKKYYRWRILLIDDKAVADMGTNIKAKIIVDGLPFNCKVSIIKNVLNRCFDRIQVREWNDSTSVSVGTECLLEFAQSKNDAILALQKRKYDIILLDYLLDRSQEGKHNYGYQILETIYSVCDSKAKKKVKDNSITNILIGPNKRFFFMFTSAYSSAVNERLLAEGLNLSEDYWHISLGACPTNTPQLFLYNLLKLMDKRLEDSGLLKLSSDSMYKLINKIYSRKEDDPKRESVRKRANAFYQKVLSLQYHYRNILKDVEIPFGQNISDFETKGSVLMTTFIKKKINLGGMLEHLTQLVHLTAFGTVRQWPEMWEEYIYFKALFEKQSSDDKDSDSVDPEKLKEMFINIENYILDLKSQPQ